MAVPSSGVWDVLGNNSVQRVKFLLWCSPTSSVFATHWTNARTAARQVRVVEAALGEVPSDLAAGLGTARPGLCGPRAEAAVAWRQRELENLAVVPRAWVACNLWVGLGRR